ncbi:hypothetical protein CEE45_01000 [Candidatus Heimdallarchaeota archaeon B3_Heim]|nr:MAG: hypothetical protein CEE45_01000 [Candidatus Heimdallarchaeota archaeon B3_Heim]
MSIQNKRLSPFYSVLLIVPLLIMSSLLLPFVGIILPQEKQSAGHYITSLRDPDLDTNPLPQSGIYRNKDSQNSPYYSIAEIEPNKAIYFPEETISVANRFNSAQTGSYAIVSQVIYLYLNSSTITNLSDTTHLIATTVTNGTHAKDYPAISDDQTYGMIDVTFTIPEMTNLTNRYGISPGDNVSIFQYYPGGSTNTTAKIENVVAFAKIDYFTVSGFSTLTEVNPGFINTASGDETFRQGEEASVVLKAQSGTTPLSGLIVDVKLHDGTTHTLISNGGPQGISYNLLDMTTGLPSTTTNGNGELRLNVTTTYPTTPENNYYFVLNTTIDPLSGYFTENYDGSNAVTNYADSHANFTIENEMDIAVVELVSVNPSSPIAPPNENYTLVTFRVDLFYAYSSDIYQVAGIFVNATLDSYPTGVNLKFADDFNDNSSGWAATNASGMIQFNITAGFPIPYQLKTPTITVVADLQHNNAPAGSYPSSYPNNPHRFIRSTGGMLTVSSAGDTISIDPDFWVGLISLNSITSTNIRPGESTTLVFEVNTTSAPLVDFSGVPVKIELNPSIAGVSLTFTNPQNTPYSIYGYRYTNSSGMIEVTVDTTYLTTPEFIPPQSVNLDLTVDFENDSQARWIGTQHLGTTTLAEFNTTWLTSQDASLSIDPNFTFYEIILASTNESGDTVIRSGDILEINFRVQSKVGGIGLAGVDVNVLLGGAYAGVTLLGGLSTTNGSGYVTVNLSTTYLITPKDLDIVLNATADLTSDPGVWLVGQKSTNPSFYSNSSYSDVEEIIQVDPQYFFGEITAPPANNPISRIGQTDEINITFRLHLSGEGTVFPDINDVNISITVDGNLPGDSNMTVLPGASFQDSVSSWVTFSLRPTENTTEKWYTVNATAHFGDAQGLVYNITTHSSVPSRQLSGVWVNGSHTNDISFTTFAFEVKNVDRIQISSQDISDVTHTGVDAPGLNVSTGYYEIYRGTTYINISGSYYDPVATLGLPSTPVRISFNWTNLAMQPQTSTLANVTTDGNGEFWANISIPTSIPLQDIQIYGWDPAFPTPQENRNPITNIRLMSRVFIPNHALIGYNGNAIFVGENVTSAGTVRDDQGVIVKSTQFIGLIENIGWDSTQEVGTAISGSLSSGSFSLDYQIPNDYALDVIAIRANVIWGAGLVNYRPRIFQLWVNIYNEINISSFEIYLPANRSTISIVNGSTYDIPGDLHRQIYISGNLIDQNNSGLNGKDINEAWNGTGVTITSGGGGFFNLSYDFTGFTNVTWIWGFSHTLDNGTTLPTTFIVTFSWIAVDDTAPFITINSPSTNQTVAIANISTTLIEVDIIDPDNSTGPGYVSLGLNTSSVTITINGTSTTMLNTVGSLFTYDWDTSNVNDTKFFISITAMDYAGNLRNSSFYVVIDVILPTATINVVSTTVDTTVYAVMNENGDIFISGNLSDSSSSTGRNSDIDSSSIQLIIRPQGGAAVLTLNSVDLNANSNSYYYAWNIFNVTSRLRDPDFKLDELNWELVLSLTDYAGNIYQTIGTVVLENENPGLFPIVGPPSQISEGTFDLMVSYFDIKSGINEDLLNFTLHDAADGTLLQTYNSNAAEVTLIAGTNASLTLNANDLNDGQYYVRVTVYDNVGNFAPAQSSDFSILHPITTTSAPPTTTTTSPSGPGVLRPIDLIQFLLLDIIALGSGIGIAVIFERVKSRRKA